MTEQPGQDPAQRLPAPRPDEERVPAPADRFTAPPAVHRTELSPERAAGIVRQSASARWVGFLAVTIVALFVIAYYFYELGAPGGLTESRLSAETEAQEVTAVERGYNVYQANCARCHGANGEGGIGPALNRQDKLFAHLSEEYLRNILEVGGRYACGNPNSQMPVWADTGNPPGPLNYRQIDELIAFLRAEQGVEYEIRDPELNEPILGPDGEPLTFEGWVDPNYQPEPGATPYPDCWADEFAQPSASASPSGPAGPSPTAGPSGEPTGEAVEVTALNIAFEQSEIAAPADTAFQIVFDNQDQGIPHDVDILDANNQKVVDAEIVTGPATATYNVPALAAGTYTFVCSVHPNMTGTLTVGG